MTNKLNFIKSYYTNIARTKSFLRDLGLRVSHFILAVILSVGAAVFEGLTVAILIPLVSSVVSMDFSPARNGFFLEIIKPFIPQEVFNRNRFIFIFLLLFVFFLTLIKSAFQYTSSLVVSYQIRKFGHNMRRFIFSRYLGANRLFFDQNNVGYLQNVLLGFTNFIMGQLIGVGPLLSWIFMVAVYIVMMFIISWRISIFLIIVFLFLHYGLRFLMDKIKKTSADYAATYGALSKKVSNILSNIFLVKSYSNEEKEEKEFSALSEKVRKNEFNIDKRQNLAPIIQELVLIIIILLLTSFVALVIGKEKIGEVGRFLVYFYILKRCQTAFTALNHLRASLALISGPFSVMLNISEEKDKFREFNGTKEFLGFSREIRFNHLNFSYIINKEVLRDISFTIEKNKMLAIVGPTGSGKSTLMNLLMRFYDPAPGSILIDGNDIRSFTLESWRRQIAFVSQDPWLFNDSLKNNIAYGLDRQISEEEFWDVLKRARLFDFIMGLPEKLDTNIGDRGITLSGGEKQRLAIARALFKKSQIIILDEATSSLDSRTERLIQEALTEVIKGNTTIVIAHRLSTIKNADKIVVIEDGRLREQGSLAELLEKKGKFYEYWQEQKFY